MTHGVRPASSCVSNVIHPWSQLTLNDPNFNASNGFPPRKVYVEGVDLPPGPRRRVADVRRQRPGDPRRPHRGGTLTYSLSPHVFGQAVAPLGGVQPEASAGHRRPR